MSKEKRKNCCQSFSQILQWSMKKFKDRSIQYKTFTVDQKDVYR